MSDFKKNPTPPVDDQALTPAFGTPFSVFDELPELNTQQSEDDVATDREAAPYFSGSWDVFNDKFDGLMEEYDGNNVIQFKDLSAQAFQIKVLAHQVIRAELAKIRKDVLDAVESVESRPKHSKQPKPGGK